MSNLKSPSLPLHSTALSIPQVQADIARLPFSVVEGPDGGCLINVQYCGEVATFTPEQVGSMSLSPSCVVGKRLCHSVPLGRAGWLGGLSHARCGGRGNGLGIYSAVTRLLGRQLGVV